MTENIGVPVPRGVVDVALERVGVPAQAVNLKKDVVRLRRQVALLRNRIEAADLSDTRSSRSKIGYASATSAAAVILFAAALGASSLLRPFRAKGRTCWR